MNELTVSDLMALLSNMPGNVPVRVVLADDVTELKYARPEAHAVQQGNGA